MHCRHRLTSFGRVTQKANVPHFNSQICNAALFPTSQRTHPKFVVDPTPVLILSAVPRSLVLAAERGRDAGPNKLGPQGPNLPPRPVKVAKRRPEGKGGGDGTGGGGGGGGSGGEGRLGRTLASLSVYTGLVGTTAIVLANLGGIDLWNDFDFESRRDLGLAVLTIVPLQLANCALLLPSFAAERPPFLTKPEDDPKVLAAAAAAAGATAAAPPAAAAAPSSAQGVDTPAVPSVANTAGEPSTSHLDATGSTIMTLGENAAQQASSQASEARSAAAGEAGAAGQRAPDHQTEGRGALPEGFLPAAAWGTSAGDERSGEANGPWADLKAALHLAQGYYISNNPTARLSPMAEAAFTLVDSAAGEMLYRGVLLTWTASWLADRATEAGLEEAIVEQLPAVGSALFGTVGQQAAVNLGLYGTCECAVAALTATFVVWSVLARSRRAVRQLETVLSGVAKAAAQKAKDGKGGAGSTAAASSSSGAGSSSGAAQKQEPKLMMAPGAPGLVSASSAGQVMTRAATIQAGRDVMQVLLLNAIFISTGGNLAASYTAAVVNQLVISALQRRGLRRMRERNTKFMKELKAYNAQVMKIVAKHKDKLSQAAAAKVDALSKDSNGVADPAGASGSPEASTVGSHGGAAQPGTTASGPAALANAATAATDGNTASPVPPVASTPEASAAGAAGSDGEATQKTRTRSGLENALAMLDQLVPEPPKPAKAAPGSGKRADAKVQQERQQV